MNSEHLESHLFHARKIYINIYKYKYVYCTDQYNFCLIFKRWFKQILNLRAKFVSYYSRYRGFTNPNYHRVNAVWESRYVVLGCSRIASKVELYIDYFQMTIIKIWVIQYCHSIHEWLMNTHVYTSYFRKWFSSNNWK